VIDEIVALSKKYGIISNYTSFLVTDPSETHGSAMNRPNPRPRPMMMRQFADRETFVGAGAALGGGAPLQASMAPKSIGRTDGPRDLNMFAVESTMVDERHYNSGRAERHQKTSGKEAVEQQKATNKLKDVDYQAKDEETAGAMKTVEEKTFYLKAGVWVDSTYTESSPKQEVIQFGSKEYFDLIHANPGISKYLAVGKEVILVFKGHCYKIVSPSAS
jgi:hypothetical protein